MVDAMCQVPVVTSGSVAAMRTSVAMQKIQVTNAKQYLEKRFDC